MRASLRRLAAIASLVAGGLSALPAQAGFSSMFVFGDSLSDTGNVYLATGGAVPTTPPYATGRFSDGPVWIDHLAAGLGLPVGATPSLAGGHNFAFGGARTGATTSPTPGLLVQIGGLWAPAFGGAADPNALYVVVGGGNDMRDARSAFSGSTPADEAGRQAAAAAAAGNLATAVGALAGAGARHILIANLPDLGTTPEAVDLGREAASTDVTQRFNALVAGLVGQMESLFAGLDVDLLDLHGIAATVRSDALNNGGARFGITNVSTPCGSFAGSTGESCAVSGFSDDLHPSAAMHALFGRAAVAAAVPEPATLTLMVPVLLLAAGAARRRRARSAQM